MMPTDLTSGIGKMPDASRHGHAARASLVCLGALIAIAGAVLPAVAASQQECRTYADNAVFDFTIATNQANAANCPVTGGRWQANWENHYQWCLTVSTAAYQGEENARKAYLVQCHAAHPIDDNN
jgi:hypothetical protein